jgi:hypothetical protein
VKEEERDEPRTLVRAESDTTWGAIEGVLSRSSNFQVNNKVSEDQAVVSVG